ncbi:MAG: SpoIID/LytB domain-containing protein [Candidatus Sericytochromatia bacterium]|nr:SpoIID/LytB domain-containing protein [Candidatus Sericytochromatia bacterium]
MLPELLRIGLLQHAATLSLTLSGPGVLLDAGGQQRFVSGGAPLAFAWLGDHLEGALPSTGGKAETVKLSLPLRLSGQDAFQWKGSWYRGEAELVADNRGLTLVDVVAPETYLRGVVPKEMPPAWPMEALKVQAVAARTYLAATLGRFAKEGFDLHADDRSQVYGGMSAEQPRTNDAVRSTAGLVLTWLGSPIKAYYSSGAGGMTEANDAVDGFAERGPDGRLEALPYLRPVVDFDWASRRYLWEREVSSDQLAGALEDAKLGVGTPLSITVAERSPSGRARWVRVRGTNGERDLPGTRLRRVLRLDSTLFEVGRVRARTFLFSGRGWGHGVGMSQSGARQLADWGWDHAEILAHYYPGTRLERAKASTVSTTTEALRKATP